MIEPIMYFGIGFLVAALLGLVVIPLVHSRAVRLTMRRLEAATPLSMAEIQADKDQLRAEFAMSTRRLEMSVEQLKTKTTSQLAELGKKGDAINRLKMELGEKTATIFALEARDKALRDQLRATEDEVAAKTSIMHDAERTLSDKEAELAKLIGALDERSSLADSQKVEIVSLKTQVEALKERLSYAGNELKIVEDRRDAERVELKAATQELAEERGRVENLGRRVAELEQQLAAQSKEAELLGRRAQDLESRLGEQSRRLAQSEFELNQTRGELLTARKSESDLRAAIAELSERTSSAAETAQGGKSPTAVRPRPHRRRTRPAGPRPRPYETRGRRSLGLRAGGERLAARAHQRRRSRSGAPCLGAGRAELADRRHPGGRNGARPRQPRHGFQQRRIQRGGADQWRPGRPHPRAAESCLARAGERQAQLARRASLDTSWGRSLYRAAVTTGRLAQRESVPFTRERS